MKKKLIKSYILPHAPILVSSIDEPDKAFCVKTCEAMEKISKEIFELKPKRIVLVSPHGALFSDAISSLYSKTLEANIYKYGAIRGKLSFNNDIGFIDKLSIMASRKGITLAKLDDSLINAFDLDRELDYGATIPLHFIKEEYHKKNLDFKNECDVVCMTYGLLSVDQLYEFGIAVRESIESSNKETVFIASGDLSHCLSHFGPYSYSPYGVLFDEMVLKSLENSDPFSFLTFSAKKRELSQSCAFQSISILFGLYDKKIFKSNVHSYEYPFGVGYLVAGIDEIDGISPGLIDKLKKWISEKKVRLRNMEDDYIRLARDTIEHFVINKKRPFWDRGEYDIPSRQSACFVTLKNDSGLRACIGSVYPLRKDLFQEIVENSVSVCTNDDRFDEIEEEELPELYVSVDIISNLEEVGGILDLNPSIYGIVVESGAKSGVLLPNLDKINSPADQLKLALKKAGINEYEEYKIKRFTIERHEVEH